MIRFWSYVESTAFAVYYAANFLSPANVRNAVQTVNAGKNQIAHQLRSRRKKVPMATALLVLLIPIGGFAQPPSAEASTTNAPVVSAALTTEVMALRRAGTEAIFNLEYTTAKAKFEEIKKLMPHHPIGDINLAMLIWLEHLNKSRRLQTSLYGGDSSFYAGAENAKEDNEGDQVDAAVDRAFRDRMAQAKTKALALIARNKNDADAQYFLGAYYGVMAGYEASVARKFFGAMRNGSRSVDAHEKTLKLKPEYYDAYLSVGMYDYIAGNLPFMYKVIATLAGVRGNKERGIERLQKIVSSETVTADDARVLLVAIYKNEKRFDDALALLKHLNNKYPASYLLKLETATLLVTLKRQEEAYAAFESLLKDPKATPAVDLVHYQYAEALASAKEYKKAAEQFLAASKAKDAEANLATLALLRAAQVNDQAGQRTEAVAHYKAVLARPNVYDSRVQAEKGLKQPFVPKEKKESD